MIRGRLCEIFGTALRDMRSDDLKEKMRELLRHDLRETLRDVWRDNLREMMRDFLRHHRWEMSVRYRGSALRNTLSRNLGEVMR